MVLILYFAICSDDFGNFVYRCTNFDCHMWPKTKQIMYSSGRTAFRNAHNYCARASSKLMSFISFLVVLSDLFKFENSATDILMQMQQST